MTELAYVNGVFGPIREAKVSIEDRGFQFGDGVYEVIAAYDGRPFLLDRHLARLQRSAAAIGLVYEFDSRPLEPIIAQGLSRSGFGDAMVYIQLTRGVAPRSHDIPPSLEPTVVMTFKPLPRVPEKLQTRGARVMTTLDPRWKNCYIKAITLLPNVLAKHEALERGYDDAIFVTPAGAVRECTAANVLAVCDGVLRLPTRAESILQGVMQSFLLECAAAIGIPVDESTLQVETLRAADEVFMSSTVVEILGITEIDDHPVGTGSVGPVTLRLLETFRSHARAQAGSDAKSG